MKTNDDSANHPADGLPRCATTKAAAAGQWSNAAQPKLKFKYFQFLPTLNFTTEKIKPEITHMKQNLIPLLAALLLQGAIVTHAATNDAPPVAVTAANNVLTVAVFDFESKDEAVRDLGPKVATLLNANLSASPSVITVERQELEKALGEQELGLSGTVSADTAAKVGQLTGAKVLITGRVFKVENQTLIVAKVIGTETSRVYGELVQGGSSASIVDLSAKLAEKIAAVVAEKGATLVAKVPTREERIAKIKQALAGKTLPVASVQISEHHYGPHIIDPAAETELTLLLQQCGFQVTGGDSKLKPEVQISGEAFSAYGMQKGNLISCKSRIEIKVSEVATGKLLFVDRQTSVGVDIAEQTAAKTALENAADTLAERILLKLAK
jgi:hypothetical protein